MLNKLLGHPLSIIGHATFLFSTKTFITFLLCTDRENFASWVQDLNQEQGMEQITISKSILYEIVRGSRTPRLIPGFIHAFNEEVFI